MNWKEKALQTIRKAKDKVVEIDLEKKSITYFKINNPRGIKVIAGDEEIVRAYLVNHLVNELDYDPGLIEIEKEYDMGRPSVKKARIDVLLKDRKGEVFFFMEVKAPDRWESDKEFIEGQLFKLVKQQSESNYLVYYTIDFKGNELSDQALIIDYIQHKEFEDWDAAGRPSISNELSAGYGKPRKPPLRKGGKKDLRTNFTHEEIISLSRNLHNVLWGGGGTSDTEVFNSLVNIIFAKIQDEDEKKKGQQYDFQIFGYDDEKGNAEIEKPEKVFERINKLYRRALEKKLNFSDINKLAKTYVVNEEKFPLSKLIYTVQQLEDISFIEGRSQVDGTDILGDFFESITRDGFKQNKGQFFTPVNIVRFILYALEIDNLAFYRLNEKQDLPYIIDPSCGSGTFLIEAMKAITKELKHKRKEEVDSSNQVQRWYKDYFQEFHENSWARTFLYGADSNFDLGTAAKVNMILHGDGSANLFVQDGLLPFTMYLKTSGGTNVLILQEPEQSYGNKHTNGQFDIVISNPPFSVDLDTQTKQKVERTFVFHKKKNSENLFVERYYQLLKENGRLGVVLPESVYDTTENKYIRLFLFRFFKIKAVVSLPQITFEPFTSTKTSLLFAQKKTAGEVEEWNKHWNKYQSEWSKLNTRVANYISVYLNGEKKEKYPSIKADDDKAAIKNIHCFLKDYLEPKDASLPVKELLEKYKTEIEEVSSIDKDTLELFGHCNSWWVFGEVSKELDYNIFMGEAENVGYKRTKASKPLPRPNDLFDIEAAPLMLDTLNVEKHFSGIVAELKANIEETENAITTKKKKVSNQNGKSNNTEKTDKELEKEEWKLKKLKEEYATAQKNLKDAKAALNKYYDENVLNEKFYERTEKALVDLFTTGILSLWKSDDVLLRKTVKIKLLDHFRQTVKWD
ncbi:MAG: restriction endonuclease subunit M [Bacteroidetes bacterium]|nr:restriction endonuclease subunit M [Bacteroidota bacterium]